MKSIADFEFNGAPLLSGIMLVLKTVRPDFDREKAEACLLYTSDAADE